MRPDDRSPPSARTPWFAFASPFPLAGDLPAVSRVRWSADDEEEICRYELEQSVDDGAYTGVLDSRASNLSNQVVRYHAFGRRYRYARLAQRAAGLVAIASPRLTH
jgi:hypothetical protein